MKRSMESLPGLWKALNLLQDYLSTGFSRSRPDVVFTQPAAEPAAQPALLESLEAIAAQVASCTACGLCSGRKTTVPGEGSHRPPVLFIGEGPGEEEDKTGRPFVGAAGKYLDKWIPAIGLQREQCFIANVVKCRPPRNREPHPEEISACLPFLMRQIQLIQPKTICCLGRIAAHALLQTTASLGSLRGRVHALLGIPLVVTYHPSAVLRDTS
ncbi:MAG TPA: uracil-DNA glycosylase, partial [Spirochaetia bacterium]|nr:uracil-DNA glycosylase [Spirochaetia bacterium]